MIYVNLSLLEENELRVGRGPGYSPSGSEEGEAAQFDCIKAELAGTRYA
jgi:hypothetical protein